MRAVDSMDMDEFQKECLATAVYPIDKGVVYCSMGLANEAGEVLGKVKKYIRGDYGVAEMKTKTIAELGDVLWYAAVLAKELDVPLGDLAADVLSKLQARKAAGTIKGDGDNR